MSNAFLFLTLPEEVWRVLEAEYDLWDGMLDLRGSWVARLVEVAARRDVDERWITGRVSERMLQEEGMTGWVTRRVLVAYDVAVRSVGVDGDGCRRVASALRKEHREELCRRVLAMVVYGGWARNRALMEVATDDAGDVAYETLRKDYYRKWCRLEVEGG